MALGAPREPLASSLTAAIPAGDAKKAFSGPVVTGARARATVGVMLSERDGAEDVGGQALLGVLLLEL